MDSGELERFSTQGFVSKKIFQNLLLIGLFCSGAGFVMDMFIVSIPSLVTIMSGSLFLCFILLLLLIHRIKLHTNMRLAVIIVLIGSMIELMFDEGGIVWMIVIPPIVFAAFGKKEGSIWSVISFILIVFLIIWDTSSQFSIAAISNITLAYIVITLVAYFYTSHIDYSHQVILQNTQKRERLEIAHTLSGGIAHLINNEMQVIIGNASMLQRKIHEPAHLKKINDIIEFAYKASHHANELLAYAENSPEYMKEHDFKDILLPLTDTWAAKLPEDIQLRLKLPDILPTCHCDSKQIEQVLHILFENAKEACQPTGFIELQATTEYLQDNMPKRHLKKGHYIKIAIQDDGVGIKDNHLDKIFEPFFSTKFTGRGLGLAAAHGIIKRHGGNLQAQSIEGQGTTLTIFLPIVPSI